MALSRAELLNLFIPGSLPKTSREDLQDLIEAAIPPLPSTLKCMYVSKEGSDVNGDGSDWAHAFLTAQAAIDALPVVGIPTTFSHSGLIIYGPGDFQHEGIQENNAELIRVGQGPANAGRGTHLIGDFGPVEINGDPFEGSSAYLQAWNLVIEGNYEVYQGGFGCGMGNVKLEPPDDDYDLDVLHPATGAMAV